MNHSRMFTWAKMNRALAEERSAAIRKELYALLKKGPNLEEEVLLAELAEQLCVAYRDVCDIQGFQRTPVLVRTVYGKIARTIETQVSSIISDLRRDQKRSGGLKSTLAQQTHLRGACKRLSSALRSKAAIRVKELAYPGREEKQNSGFVDVTHDVCLRDEKQATVSQNQPNDRVAEGKTEPPTHPVLNSWTVNRELAKLEETYKLDWATNHRSTRTSISSSAENLKRYAGKLKAVYEKEIAAGRFEDTPDFWVAAYSQKILPSTFAKINSLVGSFAFHLMRTGAGAPGELGSAQEAQRSLKRLRSELETELLKARAHLEQANATKTAKAEPMDRRFEPLRSQSRTRRTKTKSHLRNAIHLCLTMNPRASDREILKWLEDTNPKVIPASWKLDSSLPGKTFTKIRKIALL